MMKKQKQAEQRVEILKDIAVIYRPNSKNIRVFVNDDYKGIIVENDGLFQFRPPEYKVLCYNLEFPMQSTLQAAKTYVEEKFLDQIYAWGYRPHIYITHKLITTGQTICKLDLKSGISVNVDEVEANIKKMILENRTVEIKKKAYNILKYSLVGNVIEVVVKEYEHVVEGIVIRS